MKRHPLLIALGLAFILQFGAAFQTGDHLRRGALSDSTHFPFAGGLKIGEYACYGSGGQVLIGLGFKVLAGNKYTDLDGKESGTFRISDDTVTFSGGHLDGQVGKNLHDYKFNIHSASCEPF